MRALYLGIFAVALAACPGGGGGPGQDGGADGGNPGGDGGVVLLHGMVTQNNPDGGENSPVSGASVILVGGTASATTAADGTFSFDIPGGVPSFVRASASGFYDDQRAVMGVPDASLNINTVSLAQISDVTSALGITQESTKGIVVVEFRTATGNNSNRDGGFGATVSLPHAEPFAFGPSGPPVFSSTTIQGADSVLVFPNTDAGMATILLTAPAGQSCTMALPEVTSWPVAPGVMTSADAICP